MLDSNDPIIALADTIGWELFDESFEKYYSEDGRPAKPIRLMVRLLILKQLKDLSDEELLFSGNRIPAISISVALMNFKLLCLVDNALKNPDNFL